MSPRPTAEAAALLAALCLACSSEVKQPIAYDHRLHVVKLELACDTCHETSTAGEAAGLPPLSTCGTCHQEANGPSPEEKKVVEAVRVGRELPWVRLYELPRHVYFTHRRHVAVARIACERCHGEMRQQARPPPAALVALSMNDCLECHRERGASRECAACHR
jgi:Cytochrome c7 and related cytochrome c/Class III cytochrome C family